MSIKIGSARIDENGNIKDGKAGDQTGKEVMIQDYYTHSKGWYCFRPKNPTVAAGIAQSMIDACNNNNIGYDQWQRNGVYNYVKNGTKIRDISSKTECDCSALVRACCKENGIETGDIRTATMQSMLPTTGAFEAKFSVSNPSQLYNGDILVTKTTGHTVIVVSGHPRTGTTVVSKTLLSVDGEWGKATTTALQKWLGTPQDGIVSNQEKSMKRYCEACLTSSWEFNDYPGGSAVIKALQRKLGVRGDGIVGPETFMALQKFLGVAQDGYCGKQTVKALQTYLNKL